MLQIIVEGKSLDLPSDISFDYSTENRLLTNAGGYSLGIDIPLKGSKINSEVFGLIWRKDADIYSVRFNAQIITPEIQLSGVIMIVGLSDSDITVQFLSGASQQNSELSFEEMYINELKLGGSVLPKARRSISCDDARLQYGEITQSGIKADAVALPWVIKDSGEMIHNAVAIEKGSAKMIWSPQWFDRPGNNRGASGHFPTQDNLSYMPFLIEIAKRIAEAMDYNVEFSEWLADEDKRNIIICNAIPASLKLHDFSWLLPHWTINEFFENIEYILEGEFDIDHLTKVISFRTTKAIINEAENVSIDNVIDEFEAEISIDDDQDKAQSELMKNVGYADNSSRFRNMQSCDWFIRRRANEALFYNSDYKYNPGAGWAESTQPTAFMNQKRFFRYDDLGKMLEELRKYKYSQTYCGYPYDCLFYAKDVKCYFILNSVDMVTINGDFDSKHPGEKAEFNLIYGNNYYMYNILPVNEFGDFIVHDSDEAEKIELKTVPVPIDEIGQDAHAIFLPYSADENIEGSYSAVAIDINDSSTWKQPSPFQELSAEDQGRHEYYDKLYLGYWKGGIDWRNQIPYTSNIHVYSDFCIYEYKGKSMRLNLSFDRGVSNLMSMDERKLYKFSFLSNSLPNPRAEFLIKGKKYICRKLQISFSASGMSKIIKGEFYRL